MQLDQEVHTDLNSGTSDSDKQRWIYAKTDTALSGSTLNVTESENEATKEEATNIAESSVPKDHLEDLLDAFSTLSRLRNEHMLLQSQAANEVSAYEHKRKFAEESILQMIQDLSSLGWNGQTTRPDQSIEQIKTQLSDDGAALKSQSQIVIDVGSRSSSMQFRVAEAEEHFMKIFKTFVLGKPGGTEIWLDMESAAQQRMEEISEASEGIPEPAQAYFEAAGDIHILREQLFDLSQQHSEERVMREFLRDQEQEPKTPDAEFEDKHQAAQDALFSQLSEASKAAEDARRICEVEDIDIESLRHRGRSNMDDFEEPPTPKALPFFMDMFAPELPPNIELALDTTTKDAQQDVEMSSRTVKDWLTASGGEPKDESKHTKPSLPEVKSITRLEKTRRATGHPLRRTQSESMLYFDG